VSHDVFHEVSHEVDPSTERVGKNGPFADYYCMNKLLDGKGDPDIVALEVAARQCLDNYPTPPPELFKANGQSNPIETSNGMQLFFLGWIDGLKKDIGYLKIGTQTHGPLVAFAALQTSASGRQLLIYAKDFQREVKNPEGVGRYSGMIKNHYKLKQSLAIQLLMEHPLRKEFLGMAQRTWGAQFGIRVGLEG
jgi:hypothetical protein